MLGPLESFCVVIPTYNERRNLESLIPNLEDLFPSLNARASIIIVDDNSPDGTGQLGDLMASKYGNIEVIHRKGKLGLGSAYKDAFTHLLNDKRVDAALEMDADLSHGFMDIPRILEKLREGCDVVVGSRYVTGGGSERWAFSRRVISRGANFLASTILGLKVKDITSGFRAYREYVLREIELPQVKSEGYEFQVEMLYRCAQKGFKICEVPIIFRERGEGTSKLSSGDLLSFLKRLLHLRLQGTITLNGDARSA